jgi:opacity protein-like surface antigen
MGALLGLAGVWGTVAAQEQEEQPPAAEPYSPLFEVAAFGGMALGGSFRALGAAGNAVNDSLANRAAFAGALDFRIADTSQYELFYSRESTKFGGNTAFPSNALRIQYLHLGGTVAFDNQPGLSPYLAGGLGATLLDPGTQGSRETHFSASLALGLRWTLSQHFAVRLEARGFGTLLNNNTSVFCRSDQAGLLCQVHSRGSAFYQGQMLAGVAFAF